MALTRQLAFMHTTVTSSAYSNRSGRGGAQYLHGVIDDFSNYIWLLALPSKKADVPTLSSVLKDIKNLHSRLHPARLFTPTTKFVCDPNYFDVAYRNKVSSLRYAAHFTAPYTHNQLAKMERQ
jgi:hypothetical protein